MAMFGAINDLFGATIVRAKDIRILVVNCGVLNATPSLSSTQEGARQNTDLELREEYMEASGKTLERFGNTSSGSVWNELTYRQLEKSRGAIGFGSSPSAQLPQVLITQLDKMTRTAQINVLGPSGRARPERNCDVSGNIN
ncbi:hypothetical protein ACFX15_013096 [Malus domestica]